MSIIQLSLLTIFVLCLYLENSVFYGEGATGFEGKMDFFILVLQQENKMNGCVFCDLIVWNLQQ